MGKKTRVEKDKTRHLLDLQMDLATCIAHRNPKIKALFKRKDWKGSLIDGDPGYTKEEFDNICRKTYGDVFPFGAFPVWPKTQSTSEPNWLELKINLNFTKDEIMYVVEKCVTEAREKYRSTHDLKVNRKQVEKWIDYLEIWDLKNGYPPPPGKDMASRFNTICFRLEEDKGQPWTFEQIAKYLYPRAQEPQQLKRAIDRVKKQYLSAFHLICGEKYSTTKAREIIDKLEGKNNKLISCEDCPDYKNCETPCPTVMESLSEITVSRADILIDSQNHTDIEKKESRGKYKQIADEYENGLLNFIDDEI